jgi:NTP pyrophosphatase (non-canonical NTP hydrolase)
MFAIGDKQWPGISKLVEEAGEVLQVCGKLQGTGGQVNHWDGTDLKVRLEEELGDLVAAIDFVVDHCDVDGGAVERRAAKKRSLFREWHNQQPLLPAPTPTTDGLSW